MRAARLLLLPRSCSFLLLLHVAFVAVLAAYTPGSASCRPEAQIAAGRARFCVLTSRMVRLEWAHPDTSALRDSSTLLARNRAMAELPAFDSWTDDGTLVISTKHLRIEYEKNATQSFSGANLIIYMLDKHSGKTQRWTPFEMDDARQDALPGTLRTLDAVNGSAPLDCLAQGPTYSRDNHCTYALFSRKRGFVVLDDSLSATLEDALTWPWLQPAVKTAPASEASCAAVPTSERRICGIETVTETQCVAQGCCYSDHEVFHGGNDTSGRLGFHCYYSATSYQDLYFLGHGHNFKASLRDFTLLSGAIPVPPRFAFGVFYSRWWGYSDADVQHHIVERYEQHDLPLDVVVLDMDWHLTFYKTTTKDQAGQPKGWTGLTWNTKLFPDPKRFIAWLHTKGLAATMNLHPASGVQPWEATYAAVATAMGIDPQSQQYVPFRITHRKFVETWLNISIGALEADGVDFWWLDWQQGENWIEVHENRSDVNPTLWLNHVFYTNPHHWGRTAARPILLHRFGGLGNHRYPVGFSGDVVASWASLAFQPYYTAMAANVAYGYWSHDLGGFQNPSEPELFTRWLQWGALSPIFRTHSSKDAKSDRRIWKYDDRVYECTRDAMELRAALTPYLYNEAWKAHQSGVSAVHGMFIDWPEHDEAYAFHQQYMFGSSILASPVVEPMNQTTHLANKSVWLPPGSWYDLVTGSLLQGPGIFNYDYTLNEIPRFAKAGSIIPMNVRRLGTSSVGQLSYVPTALRLLIVPGETHGQLEIYEDDGFSKGYLSGQYVTTSVEYQTSCSTREAWRPLIDKLAKTGETCIDARINVTIQPVQGSFPSMPKVRSYQIEFPGSLPAESVLLDGHPIRQLEFPHENGMESAGSDGFAYAAETLSLVIYLNSPLSVNTKHTVSISLLQITMESQLLLSDGVVGKFARLHEAKMLLDEQWGLDTVFMDDYPNLLAASETDQRITYTPMNFVHELTAFQASFTAALVEVEELSGLHADIRTRLLASLASPRYESMEWTSSTGGLRRRFES